VRTGVIAVLVVPMFIHCSCSSLNKTVPAPIIEPSLEEALESWPEMPQQICFTGLVDCPTKFQVYWNGAMSCFVGRDCFGKVFPPQQEITRLYEQDQLHMTLAGGKVPDFPVIDTGQVQQSLLDGYLPIVETSWTSGGFNYSVQSLVTALDPGELDPEKAAEMVLGLMMITIDVPADETSGKADLWLNFSGYRVLVPTIKELPNDIFPLYGSKLHLEHKQSMTCPKELSWNSTMNTALTGKSHLQFNDPFKRVFIKTCFT